MKIIDEKGRLFGKINVIDFLAILFLLCLMQMFYFGYKLYKTPKKAIVEEERELEKKRQEAEKKFTADKNQIEAVYIPTEKEAEVKLVSENQLNVNDLMNDSLKNMAALEELRNRISNLEEKVNLILSSPRIKKLIKTQK